MRDLGQIFEDIMTLNRWGSEESRCGPGSSLAYTVNLRQQLEVFLRAFEIKSFFDAPCGDFNWMRHVPFPDGVEYIGGEIAPSLVAENQLKYASASSKFIRFDVSADAFPRADVWFCRDCLFHLPTALVFKALRSFCESGTQLLMMTNHLNTTGFANSDIPAGEFRLIDFYSEPYNLPRDILFRIADYVHPFPQREMCVWTREQVARALAGESVSRS
jgi:hypothetical protein